jgi:hypothetical protein
MKKKKIKLLSFNKQKIYQFNFSEKLKGGSQEQACTNDTIYPACPSGFTCPYSNGGNMG